MIGLFFLILLAVSVVAYALSVYALERLVRRRQGWACFAPPVSIVKPLCGLDDNLEENLESFYKMDYPEYEVIFSFSDRTDPAFEPARRIADRHPAISTVFVIDGREPGGNAKVNRLSAGIARTRFRYVFMTDGNVRVKPELLHRAVRLFSDASVGLVSHLFLARGARTFASRLESLYLNGVLRTGTAAMAEILGMPCVVGKSILVSRDALNTIGGIEALRDHLAEDFLLGRLVRQAGFRVVLSGDHVEAAEVSRSWGGSWSRQRCWAILRSGWAGRVMRPNSWAIPLRGVLRRLSLGRPRRPPFFTRCASRSRARASLFAGPFVPRMCCSSRFGISLSSRFSSPACLGAERAGEDGGSS